MKWHRDKESPAAIYDSIDRRYSIVWDPSGWHLWEGIKLMGVFPTLNAAKDGVRDTERRE